MRDMLALITKITQGALVLSYLNKNFSMKDLGEAAYILGIKIYRDITDA